MQGVGSNEVQHLVIMSRLRTRQIAQVLQHNRPQSRAAQSEFSEHERVQQHAITQQHLDQRRLTTAKMVDPDRGIDQNHAARGRRRGTDVIPGSLPPNRANRAAASRAINAFNASRSSAGVSLIPTYAFAVAISSSSRATVVRMGFACMNDALL